MNRFFVVIGLAGCMMALSHAETNTQQPLPPPPYLKPAAESASWIRYREAVKDGDSTAKVPASDPVSQTVRKTSGTRYEMLKFSGDKIEERWILDGIQISKIGKNILVSRTSGENVPTDFLELAWIKDASPKGWVSFKGKECLYFEGEIPDPITGVSLSASPVTKDPTVSVRAWIDAATKTPLAFSMGSVSYVYEMRGPDSSPITFPEDVAARLDKYRARSKSLY